MDQGGQIRAELDEAVVSEHSTFAVSELVEAKQRVIAYALKMAVVGRTLLLAMHLTL